jgi:SAM-dependent methyltransferase/MFS family permease
VRFLVAGALSIAAPTTALIVLQAQIAAAYGGAHANFSAIALSWLGLAATVPTVAAAIVSGTLADRYDRRRILVAVGAAAFLASLLLLFLLALAPSAAIPVAGPAGFTLPVWLFLTFPIWASLTASVTIFRPAYNAALPKLVATRDLGRANGLLYGLAVAFAAATQVLTGVLIVALGAAVALTVPVILFGLAFVFLLLLPPEREFAAPARPRRSFLADAVEGYRYLGRRADLLTLTLGALLVNFLSALALVEIAEYSTFFLRMGPAFLGLLYAASTLGAGVGALAVGHLRFEKRLGRVLGLFVVGMGGAIAGLVALRDPYFALFDMFLFGLFPGMFQTAFVAGVQATVPARVLGRVFASDEVGSYAFVPVGQYAGGLATYTWGIPATYLGAGAGLVGVGVGLLTIPAVGRFRFDPDAARPSEAELSPPGPPPRGTTVEPPSERSTSQTDSSESGPKMGPSPVPGADRKAAVAFAHRVLEIYGHAGLTALIDLGYRLGLFEAMRDRPGRSAEVARRAGLAERPVREWLAALASAEILRYDPATRRFTLPPEHAECLAGKSPLMVAPGSRMVTMGVRHLEAIARSFRDGRGVAYGAYGPEVDGIIDDLGRRRYDLALVPRYLALDPALPQRLAAGIEVADWGCGSGHILNLAARAFPRSRFVGIDVSARALARARAESRAWGLENVRWVRGDPGCRRERERYDLVLMFDTIHDQADPAGWLARAHAALRPGGLLLAVEPRASSRLEENVGVPEATYLLTVSNLFCLPVARAGGGEGLGTAWGTGAARKALARAGFRPVEVRDAPMNSLATVFLARRPARGAAR